MSTHRILLRAFCSLILLANFACGVKGKPLPPLTAPPIGRGKPTLAQPQEEIDKSSGKNPKEKNPGNSQ